MNNKQIKLIIDGIQAKKNFIKVQLEKNVINEKEYKREYKALCTKHAKYKRML